MAITRDKGVAAVHFLLILWALSFMSKSRGISVGIRWFTQVYNFINLYIIIKLIILYRFSDPYISCVHLMYK